MAALSINVVTDLFFCNNIPTFVINMDKGMETSIIRIGNSRGIIIPAGVLKKIGAKEGSRVRLEDCQDGTLALSLIPEEEPFTGPFTGPFKALAPYKDMKDPWDGEDAVEYVRKLRDEAGAEKRVIPGLFE